jgi:DNA-directed RNA polymerase subunit RPC12/RpoP
LNRLAIVGERVLAEVHAHSPASAVQALRSELDSLTSGSAAPEVPPASPAVRLPAKCPQCGGTVHPMEVEWADDRTVLCAYCGSVLLGEA